MRQFDRECQVIVNNVGTEFPGRKMLGPANYRKQGRRALLRQAAHAAAPPHSPPSPSGRACEIVSGFYFYLCPPSLLILTAA
jgi:hypothetical protein